MIDSRILKLPMWQVPLNKYVTLAVVDIVNDYDNMRQVVWQGLLSK